MNKRIYITLGTIFLAGMLSAQNVDFKAGNFKDQKEEFKAAVEAMKVADEKLEQANELTYSVRDPKNLYLSAIQGYEIAYKLNPNNAELNFKMGNALLYSHRKSEALEYLIKAEKLDPKVDDFLDFYLGMGYQLKMEFGKAIRYYEQFETSSKSKQIEELGRMLKKRKKECRYGKELIQDKKRVWVDNVEELNTEFSEDSPCISTDGGTIIFTSNRNNGHKANEVGNYDNDIYITQIDDGKWSKPKNMGAPLNTLEDETATMLSYDGSKLLLFKYDQGNTSFDLMESHLKGSKWSEPESVSHNINNNDDQTHGSFDHTEKKYFLLMNKEVAGRSSGNDIYMSGVIDKSKKRYGHPQPVGIKVNTKFDEGSVFMHPNGDEMYFSSQGHNSMGGYDIFVSEFKQGQWQEPRNLGYPINTPYDDLFFAGTANGKFAYIASNREGGKGGMDIYKVTFWGPDKEPITEAQDFLLASVANPIQDVKLEKKVKVDKNSLTVFKGKTVDALTSEPVEAKIEIIDNSKGELISDMITNSETGKFLLALNSGKNYGISVKADGYLFHSENFDIPELSEYNLVNKVIELKNIKKGSTIALRNVFFDTGKATLRPASNTELARLVKLMNDVPGLKVEISGHTDNTGSNKINEKLSQDRAQAVVDYLVSKGISKDRFIAKGYGSSKPVASNKSSEGRQQNRRTEFKIIEN